jgi:hypothetical protein
LQTPKLEFAPIGPLSGLGPLPQLLDWQTSYLPPEPSMRIFSSVDENPMVKK